MANYIKRTRMKHVILDFHTLACHMYVLSIIVYIQSCTNLISQSKSGNWTTKDPVYIQTGI